MSVEKAVQVVKKIFTLCMSRRRTSPIAVQLEKNNILTPTVYKSKKSVKIPHTELENPYHWYESIIVNILERKECIGQQSISRPTPILFETRSGRKIPKKIELFSTTFIRSLSSRNSLTRHRRT